MADVLTVVIKGFEEIHKFMGRPEITVAKVIRLGGGDPSQGKAIATILGELSRRKYLKQVARHGNRIAYVERVHVSKTDIINAYNEVISKKYSSKIKFEK